MNGEEIFGIEKVIVRCVAIGVDESDLTSSVRRLRDDEEATDMTRVATIVKCTDVRITDSNA